MQSHALLAHDLNHCSTGKAGDLVFLPRGSRLRNCPRARVSGAHTSEHVGFAFSWIGSEDLPGSLHDSRFQVSRPGSGTPLRVHRILRPLAYGSLADPVLASDASNRQHTGTVVRFDALQHVQFNTLVSHRNAPSPARCGLRLASRPRELPLLPSRRAARAPGKPPRLRARRSAWRKPAGWALKPAMQFHPTQPQKCRLPEPPDVGAWLALGLRVECQRP